MTDRALHSLEHAIPQPYWLDSVAAAPSFQSTSRARSETT